MEKISKINELVKELNQYRNEYYNLNKPSIDDSTYDKKFNELQILEKSTGLILSNSPSITVGYEVKSKLKKRVHPTPLKSLDKTKAIDELNRFRNDKDIILMLKADGLTVELDYENHQFIGGYTRGNGEIGEDISHNCRVFKNIPMTIPFKGKLRISGEAIIHWNDFNEINSRLSEEEKYATPRNLSAGSVRQLDSKICSERNVYFYVFNILECSENLSDSKYENFKWLGDLGFCTIANTKISDKFDTPEYQLERLIELMKNIAIENGIPIDGMVLSFDSIKYSNTLTETSHHPLHSLAFKFKDESETTTLREIEWSVGRTGVVTPVAIFDKVLLDNTEVTRASVHNLSIMEELELGIGDSISIYKANMIIPQIEENFTRSNNLVIPEICPICGGTTIIDQDNESKFLYCTNEDCSAKLIKKFSHFVSRDAMNIDGLSEAGIETFLDNDWIETFVDLYRLDRHKTEIIKTEGFGVRSYEKLIQAIEKSKTVKLESFIYALGIDQIGKGGAKRLAKHFEYDIQNLFDAIEDKYDFTQVEDFGEITHDSLTKYFANQDNCNTVVALLDFIKFNDVISNSVSDSPFSGKKIYCTGSFASYKKEELKSILEGLGAEFTSGYAKSLDYLIVGSLKGSGKEDKAKRDGVKIMAEDEFLDIIGRNA